LKLNEPKEKSFHDLGKYYFPLTKCTLCDRWWSSYRLLSYSRVREWVQVVEWASCYLREAL